MNLFLQLQINRAEGALERILQVVRFRGFEIHHLAAQSTLDNRHFNLTLSLFSSGPDLNLRHQLEKLLEVNSVLVFVEAESNGLQTAQRPLP